MSSKGRVWNAPVRFRMKANPVSPIRIFSTRLLKAWKSIVARRIQGLPPAVLRTAMMKCGSFRMPRKTSLMKYSLLWASRNQSVRE